MDPALIVFLVVVLIGCYLQAVAGFGLGMLLVAVVGGFGLVSLPALAATISILALVNSVYALRGHRAELQVRSILITSIGQLPAIALGVFLLDYLSQRAVLTLELMLGVFLVLSCASMLFRPKPRAQVSKAWAWLSAGFFGGLAGGLFAASAPVLGWFAYRQPLAVAQIRATLLAIFMINAATRTVIVAVSGGMTKEIGVLVALGMPAVLIGTWLGRLPPPISESALRRSAVLLLLALGCWISLRSSLALLAG